MKQEEILKGLEKELSSKNREEGKLEAFLEEFIDQSKKDRKAYEKKWAHVLNK